MTSTANGTPIHSPVWSERRLSVSGTWEAWPTRRYVCEPMVIVRVTFTSPDGSGGGAPRVDRHGLDAVGGEQADGPGPGPQPGLQLVDDTVDPLPDGVAAAVGDVEETDRAEQRVEAGGDHEDGEHHPSAHARQRSPPAGLVRAHLALIR